MKECDNCAYGGWLNGKEAITEICTKCRYICGEPTKWKAKPMTNADRIRYMSDEELCKFLGEYKFCDICEEGCDSCTYNGDCDKRLLDWLKQPAEGE